MALGFNRDVVFAGRHVECHATICVSDLGAPVDDNRRAGERVVRSDNFDDELVHLWLVLCSAQEWKLRAQNTDSQRRDPSHQDFMVLQQRSSI
jgi:hypothetical protein